MKVCSYTSNNKAQVIRIGSIVYYSQSTVGSNIVANTQYINNLTGEAIKAGYRPKVSTHMTVVMRAGYTILGYGTTIVKTDGNTYSYCSHSNSGNFEWDMTGSWYTENAFPS